MSDETVDLMAFAIWLAGGTAFSGLVYLIVHLFS